MAGNNQITLAFQCQFRGLLGILFGQEDWVDADNIIGKYKMFQAGHEKLPFIHCSVFSEKYNGVLQNCNPRIQILICIFFAFV